MAIAPVLAAASCGYLRNVRDDFLDIGTLAVGAVPPVMPFSASDGEGAKSAGFIPPAIGVYVEATDFVHAGALYKDTVDADWDRRGLGIVADERTKLGFGPCHSVKIEQKPIYTNDYKISGNDLDAWREVRLKSCDMQANEADQLPFRLQLRCKQAEAMIVEVALDVVDQLIALFTSKYVREELHHARVGVHFRKGFAIGILPTSKNEAIRFQHD